MRKRLRISTAVVKRAIVVPDAQGDLEARYPSIGLGMGRSDRWRIHGLRLQPGEGTVHPDGWRNCPSQRRPRQRAVSPFRGIGFHWIDLITIETAQFGLAGSVGRCHQSLFALRAADRVHGILPSLGISRTHNESSGFIKTTGTIGFVRLRTQERILSIGVFKSP